MKRTVICHLFYPDNSLQLIQRLSKLDDGNTVFFVNIQGNSTEHDLLYNEVRARLSNVKVLKTPNKGRDIGAKLFLISLMLELGTASDYSLVIHDKKSPHLEYGNMWRDELFKIADPRNLSKVFQIFKNNPGAGIVCAAKYIQNEYLANSDSFACNSSAHIRHQLRQYDIQTTDHDFVAGNIFWIRTDLIKTFFATRNIMDIRAGLESGNALDFNNGTNIHSWERIMSWIATSQGYKIYGL
jgi:lipopolysaccharide biosynthesis protein